MAKKSVNTAIEEVLVSNSDFEYAHLIKFERPFAPDSETDKFRTNANRYAYYTDGPRDISFDDGSTDQDGNSNGSQVYRANRILNIGSYSETTTPRATNMSLTFAGEHLGTSIVLQGTFTSATFTATTQIYKGEPVDFVEEGFREGDKIKFTKSSGNFSTGVSTLTYIITGFTTNNTVITLATTGNDTDDATTYPTDSNTQVTLSLESDELSAITNERVVSTLTNPSFLNREVFIHKVFIDPETGDLAGNSSILIFRGIIAKCNLNEGETSSRVKWALSSHWADFNQINGRITSDEIHRALDGKSRPQPNMAIKPEYATDLGFMHSETTLNQIAIYQTTETRSKLKSKRRGGPAGWFGGRKYYTVEEKYQVDNEVDLSVNLQGKHLPIVYGVQRINGIPIFADTDKNDSKKVYVAYAISEGEIHGIYNIYIEGAPLICTDKADFDLRNASTGNDKDNSQLQCYGRADKGDTLGGAGTSYPGGATALLAQISGLNRAITSLKYSDSANASEEILELKAELYELNRIYKEITEGDAGLVSGTRDARGLYHEQMGSIQHPYNMEFHFYSGKSDQRAANLLVTKAQANGFKRQNDYYEGTLPYWSTNHRLLDTAYIVTLTTINEDQTTVPELEYVVKGKLVECYNYDNTYEPGLSSSDLHTNFLQGDIVTVERSTNGSSYSTATSVGSSNTSFRILDKYVWTGADGSQFYRFRLDKRPDLGYNDGVPSYPYLRLKQANTSNYWHMRTYNAKVVENATLNLNKFNPTSVSDSSGTLTMTFSTNDATVLKTGFPYSATSGLMNYQVFLNNATHLDGLEQEVISGTWSGNTITFTGLTGYAGIASTGANLTSIEVLRATAFTLTNSTIQAITLASDLVGETITLNETGESRVISNFFPATDIIVLDTPFFTLTEQAFDDGLTYTISSTKGDRRASNNPAMQLLDYISDKGYGKDLDLDNDINLESFIASARLCDTRSDVTITLVGSSQAVTVGDEYYLTVDGNSSSATTMSGIVLSKEVVDGNTKVTFTDVSGKFSRKYNNYTEYVLGDIVYSEEAKFYRVTDASAANSVNYSVGGFPTHSGSQNGFTYITNQSLAIYKRGSSTGSITWDVTKEVEYSLYDADFIKYWRYLGWESHDQMWVTRHQTNFVIDSTKSVFQNVNAFLSHFNGILSYANGKYTLDVETQTVTPQIENTFNSVTYDENINPEYIDNTDIIGAISLNDDSARNSKNTIKASIFDPQNNWSTRAVSFFNSDFVKADRGLVKTASYTVSGITNYYNARISVEKELIQSRFSKEISFTVGQKGLLLKAGAVIAVTYDPFKFDKKLFRIENATFNPNCTVSIKAREYDDSIYNISKQRASTIRQEASTQVAALSPPGTPTNLSATTDKPGVVILSWDNATNFNEPTDSTQIWVSDDNNRANATKVATLDDTVSFSYALAQGASKYFWIRHARRSTSVADNSIKRLTSAYHPVEATGGVNGQAKILSPQLDVDVSSIQIKFNDSGALTPTGTAQDVKLTATLRNITPDSNGVVFTLIDADQTSQSDVQFTNGSTTLTDTSSPYEATVDASSASNATTNKFVKITTTDQLGEVFTELVPISITKDGSSGSTGIAAAAVKLEPSTSVITYGANDPDAEDPETTITFTTDLQGNTGDSTSAFSGTPYYEFLIDGTTSGSISTTSTFTLPDSSEPADGETVEVKVKVRDGGTSGTVKATDSVTIFGIKSGSDSITAFLTNSAHVVSATQAGAVSNFTGAGGTFKVFVGSTDRTTSCTFSEVSGQESSGLTSSINSSTGVYEVTALSVDTAQNTFRATIPANISPTGVQTTIDQTYSISKSKQGTPGAGGTDARTVKLTANDYSIIYDEDGANPTPSGVITLTATTQGFANSGANARFKFTGDGITDETSYTAGTNGNDTQTFAIPTTHFSSPQTIKVSVADSGDLSEEIAFDIITLTAIKDGSDSYTVILDNEAHAIPSDSTGQTLVYTGSGATIEVYRGSNELNGITSGTPTTGQFKVTASGSGITPSSTNGTSSGNPVVFADHSGMSADNASITYSVNVEGIQTVTKKQTFTKVKDAATLTVSSNIQVFSFEDSSDTTPTPSTAAITVNQQNQASNLVTGDITVTNGTKSGFSYSGSNGTGTATITVTPSGTYPVTVEVSNDNLSDSLQIAKVTDGDEGPTGTAALSGVLTNENSTASVFTYVSGAPIVTYTNTGGTFKVFQGTSLLSSGVTFGISGGSAGSTTTTKTQNGITMTINNSTGAYTLSGGSWSTEEEEFTLTATHTSSSTTIQKVYNINKITNASNVEVTANEQAFMYDENGSNPSPSSITLTAASYNTYNPYGTFEFKFTKSTDGGSTFSTTVQDWTTVANGGETVSISAGNLSLGNEVFKVQLRGGVSSSKIIDEDTITLLRLKDGEDGDTGQSVKTVELFKKNDSTFSTTTAGNFSNPTSGAESGWTTTQPTPTTPGDKIYMVRRTFTSDGQSPQDSSWSSPVIVAQLGDGLPRVLKLITIYNTSTSKSGISEPTDTTTGTPYNFETGAFSIGSGGSSGWQEEPIGFGTRHWQSRVTVVESSFGGAQTVTYSTAYRVGGSINKDPVDWIISWDDNNNRILLEIDGTVVSQPTYPLKLRNDQIDQTFIQNKITDPSTFRSDIGAGTSSFGGSQADIQNAITNSSTFRGSIGAGTSSFGGQWNNLTGTIPTSVANSSVSLTGLGYTGALDANNYSLPGDVLKGTISVNGTTVTIPKSDGTTYQINTQDTNTTYTSLSQVNSTEASKLSGIASGATNNGTKINSSGNITGAIEMGSKFTLDSSNERLLIED